jgi:hypothetical protein
VELTHKQAKGTELQESMQSSVMDEWHKEIKNDKAQFNKYKC